MAPSEWKDLPADILSIIAKINYCDIHRLRFVCTSWRASLPPPPPQNRFSFPLRVPANGLYDHTPTDGENGLHYLTLRENTLYCFSPLASHPQSGDSSNCWMIKVTETSSNPKVFALLKTLSPSKMYYPPSTIPESLNLLDYRISEVCKSYSLDASIHEYKSRKVIPLWNYLADCDFAVLSLAPVGDLRCWKFGDESWTRIDTIGRRFNDITFFNGKCYAIDSFGVLVCLDAKLTQTVVASFPPAANAQNLLVECKSDLYLVSPFKRVLVGYDFFESSLMMSKFNKCNGNWDCVGDLGENVLLLGDDLSVGVSAKDFEGFEGNSLYVTEPFINLEKCDEDESDDERRLYGDMAGLYRLDDPTKIRIKVHLEFSELNWRPPSWLMPFASSLEP